MQSTCIPFPAQILCQTYRKRPVGPVKSACRSATPQLARRSKMLPPGDQLLCFLPLWLPHRSCARYRPSSPALRCPSKTPLHSLGTSSTYSPDVKLRPCILTSGTGNRDGNRNVNRLRHVRRSGRESRRVPCDKAGRTRNDGAFQREVCLITGL